MKKRILAMLLCIILCMSAVSCKKEPQTPQTPQTPSTDTPTVSTDDGAKQENTAESKTICLISGTGYAEEHAEDSYQTIIRTSYPVLHLYYGDEAAFPALENTLLNSYEEKRQAQLGYIEENRAYAFERYEEQGEDYYPFESELTPYVRRADTLVTSILYSGYAYFGGAHGESFLYGENYNTKTGKALALSEVVNDMDALAAAVYAQLELFRHDAEEVSFDQIEEIIHEGTSFSWTLDYHGITVYFMPYVIGSYATGHRIATISNEEYPDVLKEEFKAAPKSYGVELVNYTPFYYDVTGDGKVDEILFNFRENDDEGNDGCISISVNGTDYSEKTWFYDTNATMVHAEDGKNYIYVEILRENDYREIVCFDLSYGVKKIGNLDGGMRRIYHEGGEYFSTRDVLTQPEAFRLQKTTHQLSTVSGYKTYHVGEDGMPITQDAWYTFDEESMPTFTLRQELELDIYDENSGEVIDKILLLTGEEVLYYSTDNEKYALLKLSDGTLCRVEVNFSDDWYYAINGQNVEDIFDGVVYAG